MNKLIIIVGIVVLALVLGLLLLWPKYQQWQTLRLNIQQREAELQSKQGYYAQVRVASSTLAEYAEPFAKIASALPDDPSLPPLLNFFQSTAAQTGLLLEKVNLGGVTSSPQNPNAPKEVRVTIQLRGSYQSLKDFVATLESSARMIEIEKLSFASSKDVKVSPLIKIDTKVYSY